MEINFKDLLTVSFTLFAVIDIVGAVPVLISLKTKLGGINEFRATLVSGGLMILVASPRIERGSRASETLILSIVLRGRYNEKIEKQLYSAIEKFLHSAIVTFTLSTLVHLW